MGLTRFQIPWRNFVAREFGVVDPVVEKAEIVADIGILQFVVGGCVCSEVEGASQGTGRKSEVFKDKTLSEKVAKRYYTEKIVLYQSGPGLDKLQGVA